LFVAVWPSPAIVEQLVALPRAHEPGVRWTDPSTWHVTLVFLGRCDEGAATGALDRLDHVAVTARLAGRAGRLGRDALVLPVDGLDSLALAVAGVMVGLGDAVDTHPFFGHLTMARLRQRAACRLIGTRVDGEWDVDDVALVRSIAGDRGPVYETVARRRLRPVEPSRA
jgi:2'-5' RNA ligase